MNPHRVRVSLSGFQSVPDASLVMPEPIIVAQYYVVLSNVLALAPVPTMYTTLRSRAEDNGGQLTTSRL